MFKYLKNIGYVESKLSVDHISLLKKYIKNRSKKPKIGKCVAFPGHLPHFVEPNTSDKRIILSTNLEYFPKDEKYIKNV